MTSRARFGRLIGAALALLALAASSGAATKLRVTHIPGAPVYKAPVLGQPIIVLPLNTVLDAEVKQGEFWKVTVDKDGVKTTGYVHEFLVEEVAATETGESAGPIGSIKTQAQLTAEIELKIEEYKNLILLQSDLPAAVENLRSLLPKLFSLEDPQKQKQVACDIYLWTGHALAKMDEDAQAIREFRNMFEVDFLSAKAGTKYVADSNVGQLIGTAEKQYNGTFVGYTLQVDTEPKEAVLKVNGKMVGRTPDVYTSDHPRVTLEIEKEGYKPEKHVITLRDGKNVKSFVLQRLGRTLRVGSDPPGAAVLLDGGDTGKVTDCEFGNVPFGSHRLALRKDGYVDWEGEITVPEGTDAFSTAAKLTAKAYTAAVAWGNPDSKTFVQPKSLTLDKAGNFYVVDDGPFKVRKYGPDRLADITWGGDGRLFRAMKLAYGIAIDGEGACYITDAKDGNVSRLDKAGKFIRKWGDAGVKEGLLSEPLGVAADGNNDIYVVDSGNGRIMKYSSSGVRKKTWGKTGSGPGEFRFPAGVAVNSRNEVIVVEAARVQKFTSEGVFIEAFGRQGSAEGEFKRLLGVCCDKDDNIFVADAGNNRVMKFSPNGRFIGSFGSAGTGLGEMMAPVAVAVDAKGSVFVLERDSGRIQEFRPPAR